MDDIVMSCRCDILTYFNYKSSKNSHTSIHPTEEYGYASDRRINISSLAIDVKAKAYPRDQGLENLESDS